MILSGLDVIKGLERYNGDIKSYTSNLHTYSKYVRALLGTIENVDKKWLDPYRLIIHSIKVTSFDIYANQIGKWAKRLEKAANLDAFDYIDRFNPLFLENAHRFLDSIDTMLVESEIGKNPDWECIYRKCS